MKPEQLTRKTFAERLYFLLCVTGMERATLASNVGIQQSRVSELLNPKHDECERVIDYQRVREIAMGLGFRAEIFFVEDYASCVYSDFRVSSHMTDATTGQNSDVQADTSLQPA